MDLNLQSFLFSSNIIGNQDGHLIKSFSNLSAGTYDTWFYRNQFRQKILDDNPDIGFSIPKEGTNLFVDAMCIPTSAKHKAAAETYINFLCRGDVALNNIEYIQYSSPQMQAAEQHKKYIFDKYGQVGLDLVYPSDLTNTETYTNLPNDTNVLMDRLWVDVKTDASISLSDANISTGSARSAWQLVAVIGCFALAWIAIFIYKKRQRKRG